MGEGQEEDSGGGGREIGSRIRGGGEERGRRGAEGMGGGKGEGKYNRWIDRGEGQEEERYGRREAVVG